MSWNAYDTMFDQALNQLLNQMIGYGRITPQVAQQIVNDYRIKQDFVSQISRQPSVSQQEFLNNLESYIGNYCQQAVQPQYGQQYGTQVNNGFVNQPAFGQPQQAFGQRQAFGQQQSAFGQPQQAFGQQVSFGQQQFGAQQHKSAFDLHQPSQQAPQQSIKQQFDTQPKKEEKKSDNQTSVVVTFDQCRPNNSPRKERNSLLDTDDAIDLFDGEEEQVLAGFFAIEKCIPVELAKRKLKQRIQAIKLREKLQCVKYCIKAAGVKDISIIQYAKADLKAFCTSVIDTFQLSDNSIKNRPTDVVKIVMDELDRAIADNPDAMKIEEYLVDKFNAAFCSREAHPQSNQLFPIEISRLKDILIFLDANYVNGALAPFVGGDLSNYKTRITTLVDKVLYTGIHEINNNIVNNVVDCEEYLDGILIHDDFDFLNDYKSAPSQKERADCIEAFNESYSIIAETKSYVYTNMSTINDDHVKELMSWCLRVDKVSPVITVVIDRHGHTTTAFIQRNRNTISFLR